MQGYCETFAVRKPRILVVRSALPCIAQFENCIWKASKDQKPDLSLFLMHCLLKDTSPLSEPLTSSPGEITPVSKTMMLCESFPWREEGGVTNNFAQNSFVCKGGHLPPYWGQTQQSIFSGYMSETAKYYDEDFLQEIRGNGKMRDDKGL